MFKELIKDLKDDRAYWEMDLVELETQRRKTKKTVKIILGIFVFFTIPFFIGQIIHSWVLMDSAGFVMVIEIIVAFALLLDRNWINYYIYLSSNRYFYSRTNHSTHSDLCLFSKTGMVYRSGR